MATAGTFTSSDGVTLAFTDSWPASGDGRTVVLVAGYAMPATGWALQEDALVAAGHRVVAGRDSQLWPSSHAAAAIGTNPHGSVTVIEDAGHATNLDQPDVFNEVLLGFVAAAAAR